MNQSPFLAIFDVSGSIQSPHYASGHPSEPSGDEAGLPQDSPRQTSEPRGERLWRQLSDHSDEIAEEIEGKLARMIRLPGIAVQADVEFSPGNTLIGGTIALVAWLAPVALNSVKKTIESEVGRLVEVGMKRVIKSRMRRMGAWSGHTIELSAVATPGAEAGTATLTSNENDQEAVQVTPMAPVAPLSRLPVWAVVQLVLLDLILVAQLALLLSQRTS